MTRRDANILEWLKNYHKSLLHLNRVEEAMKIEATIETLKRLSNRVEHYIILFRGMEETAISMAKNSRELIVSLRRRKPIG